MKTKIPLIIGLIFIILVNTSTFWNRLPGLWDLSISLGLLVYYFVIVILFIILLVKSRKSKDGSRQMRINIIILGIIVISSIIFPNGIINYRTFEGKIIFAAQAEGTANCTTNIKLKPNKKYIIRSVCFGVDETRGEYTIENDTIKFYENIKEESGNEYSYGIIEVEFEDYPYGILKFYSNTKDSIPSYYEIYKNDI